MRTPLVKILLLVSWNDVLIANDEMVQNILAKGTSHSIKDSSC